jgi:hypothetical protein
MTEEFSNRFLSRDHFDRVLAVAAENHRLAVSLRRKLADPNPDRVEVEARSLGIIRPDLRDLGPVLPPDPLHDDRFERILGDLDQLIGKPIGLIRFRARG